MLLNNRNIYIFGSPLLLMAKSLEEIFHYKSALTLDPNYIVDALQSMLRNKNGFLEMIYSNNTNHKTYKSNLILKLENGSIVAFAITNIEKEKAQIIYSLIENKDIMESIANANKKATLAKFYNNGQTVDKTLNFCDLKEPLILDDKFFLDLWKYLK